MIGASLPPALILIAGGFLLPLLGGWWRRAAILVIPAFALWVVWTIPDGVQLSVPFIDLTALFPRDAGVKAADFNLILVEGSRLSRLFGTVFTFLAFAGGLFALKQERVVELSAAFVYAGSAVGVCFAGDIVTVFVFWEIMAVASTVVIWSAHRKKAYQAGMRYVAIHLLGGVLLMAGVVDYILASKSIAFGAGPIHEILGLDRPGTWLILAGFLINAGAPPLSAWLPDAYPEASYSGTVFLSAFTTKTAIFVLIKAFAGFEPLIWVGLYMIFYGILYALLENDIRRILSYSIVNQVGFMLTGIGLAGSANPELNQLALNGVASQAFAHIIYKALLLMAAGAVLYQTGKRKHGEMGGLFRSMPVTAACAVIGALTISAFPLTSGFVTKSMISSSAAEQHMAVVWFLLMAASAGSFLYVGLRLPWLVFFGRDSGLRPADPPWHMQAAMILLAFLCIAIGVWPEPLYAILPFPVSYKPYTGYHVVEMLQLLLFAGLAFFLMLPLMKRSSTISLDFDWFYRVFGKAVSREFRVKGGKVGLTFLDHALRQGGKILAGINKTHGPDGILARTWHTGGMVAWIAVLLVVYMVVYFTG